MIEQVLMWIPITFGFFLVWGGLGLAVLLLLPTTLNLRERMPAWLFRLTLFLLGPIAWLAGIPGRKS
jgi:hypothetical protein